VGPEGLNLEERRALLSDAVCLRDVHAAVWRLEDAALAQRWGIVERPAGS